MKINQLTVQRAMMMVSYLVTSIAVLCLLLMSNGSNAEQADKLEQLNSALWQLKKQADYSRKGADTCLRCHDNSGSFPVLDIFAGKHGDPNHPQSPFVHLQCETCHGPIGDHDARRLAEGESREDMFTFGNSGNLTADEQNQICLDCHQQQQAHWEFNPHAQSNQTCTSCHSIHQANDRMLQAESQAQTCGSCHQLQLAQTKLASTHPIASKLMSCNDCHSQHQKPLQTTTLNQTCYQCHADKQGPRLWPHQPVDEDCSTCHEPHGSQHKPMLTQQSPFLCQQCHGGVSHAGVVADKDAFLSNDNAATLLFNRGCVNCHTQVHGSNHPSGSGLQR